jgi:hypothetical protein
MKVFIPNYNKLFNIIQKSGNYALIDLYGKKIVFNVLGYEIQEFKQQTLF